MTDGEQTGSAEDVVAHRRLQQRQLSQQTPSQRQLS